MPKETTSKQEAEMIMAEIEMAEDKEPKRKPVKWCPANMEFPSLCSVAKDCEECNPKTAEQINLIGGKK